MSSEHATVDTTTVPTVEAVPDRPLAAALPTADLRVAPAWAREEDPFVTDPDGPDERRADAVAEALLAAPPPSDLPVDLPGETPPGGVPLSSGLQAWAARVTTADLHDVRLHRSAAHDREADLLSARAFTRGRDVVLGSGVAPLSTRAGLVTLAHELGHVVAPPAGGRIGRDQDERGPYTWTMRVPPQDVDAVVKKIPSMAAELATLEFDEAGLETWTPEAIAAGAVENVRTPVAFIIMTADFFVSVDSTGSAMEIAPRDSTAPDGALSNQMLLDRSTGVSWLVGDKQRPGQQPFFWVREGDRTAPDPQAGPGESWYLISLPGLKLTPKQLETFRKQAKAYAVQAAQAAGPPGWSKDQAAKLRKRKATGPQEGAGGQGEQGTGEGGGGTDEETKEGDPPLRGPATYQEIVGGDGKPALRVTVDQATTYVALNEGETTDALEKRVDEAVEALQESRDPDNSLAVRGGVTTTGVVQPKGSTKGVAQTGEQAAKQAGSTALHTTPGELTDHAKGGTANAPEYPSSIEMSNRDPQFAATTVRGASNEFTMELQYAARSVSMQDEVWNRLQNIQFYWEIIDVTGVVKPTTAPLISQEEADQEAAGTALGAGEQQKPFGEMGTNFARNMDAIVEDQQKDLAMMAEENWSWEARAAYLGVIGISNSVRMIGSIIGTFIDTLTQPLNARTMGFDHDGDFIVRCVATPLVSDKARADPEHHVIRKSSVAVLPIRVQSIRDRATEAVGREEENLKAKQAALVKAQAGESEAKKQAAQVDLDETIAASKRGGKDTYDNRIAFLREQVELAKALKKHRAEKAPSDQWSDGEVGLAIRLFARQQDVDKYLAQMEHALTSMVGEGGEHETWVAKEAKDFVEVGGRRDFRPRMVLASEENGQVSDLLVMLGQVSPGASAPWRWELVDITSPGSRDVYTGSSSLAGPAGRAAAIRAAFRDFAETSGYGRGTIAIRLPQELIDAVGPLDVEATMRSAPGAGARVKQRLGDLARVVGAAAIFATGGAAIALGAVAGVAGMVVSVDSLLKRARTGHLLEAGTIFDVLGVIGGVASVISVGTFMTRESMNVALAAHAKDLQLGKAAELPTWVRNVQTIDRVVHIQGQVAGVLTLLKIPFDLVEEWGKIDEGGGSEGQKRSRKLRSLLHALESGGVTVAGLAGGFGDQEPAAKPKGEPELPAPKTGEPTPRAGEPLEPQGGKPPVDEPVAIVDTDSVDAAKALAAKRAAESAQAEREVVSGKDEEILPGEDGRTASGTTKGAGEPQAEKPIPDKNGAARDEVLATLEGRVGKALPINVSDVPPPKPGEYGASTQVAAEAVALYDKAVAEVGGKREVGIFYNPNTGEFQVMVGTEHAVGSPRNGDGWRALVHLHPNPENVITFRQPAPADIEGSVKAAMRNGSHVEYVQSTLPDGTTMMTKVTITTKPLEILVEMPGQHGEPPRVIKVGSTKEYVERYNEHTRAMDPSSDAFKWMMADLDAYYARKRREDGRTASGTLSEPPAPSPDEPRVATEADINQAKQELERLRDVLKDPKERAVLDEELRTLERLRKELAEGRDVTQDLADVAEQAGEYRKLLTPVDATQARALAARTRKEADKAKKGELKQELMKISAEADALADALEANKKPAVDPRETMRRLRNEEAAAGRRDEVTIIELSDPNERKLVHDFIVERSGELSQEQIGQLLLERLLEYLQTADALVLKQSPRSAGHEVAGTKQMRDAVRAKVKAGGYPDYYIHAFNEALELARKQDPKADWPRDAAGRSWEVDHVAELWLGGADDPTNYLALPESIHDIKSDIFKQLMFRYRDRSNPGEQTDRREK